VVRGEGILAGERAVAKMWWPRLARERASAAPMLLAEQPVTRMVLGIESLFDLGLRSDSGCLSLGLGIETIVGYRWEDLVYVTDLRRQTGVYTLLLCYEHSEYIQDVGSKLY
jgi:hypothetical protein